MRDIFVLLLHAIVTIVRLAKPGSLRSVVAESVLMRHEVLILNRGRTRAPNLRASDRIIAALCTLFISPVGYRLKDLDPAAFSQDAGPAKIPVAVFSQASASAGSERSDERTD